jgi:hypothetical protein
VISEPVAASSFVGQCDQLVTGNSQTLSGLACQGRLSDTTHELKRRPPVWSQLDL